MSDEKKAETKIFSIDEGEWNNEIPGVTRLISINAQDMKKLKEVTSIIPAAAPETVAPVIEMKKEPEKPAKFSDFGIFIEHQFRLRGPRFVYQKSISHTDSTGEILKPWQKAILEGMEIDHKIVKNQGVFHEYAQTQQTMSEIFAGTAPAYVQFVRFPATGDELSVFQSSQTCLIKREQLVKLVEDAQKAGPAVTESPGGAKVIELKASNDDDDKIELDVA